MLASARDPRSDTPEGGWTALIDDILAGRWIDPETGEGAKVPYESIVIRESLDGAEADLVAPLKLQGRMAVVADPNTYDALGQRVARALHGLGEVDVVVLDRPHADMATVATLTEKLHDIGAVIAVGSGTINDLCKYVTGLDGRRYCVFSTAGSMNGYTSTTASITLETGLKVSLPSHAPAGFFVDLAVSAAAPKHLSASGFGDCLARSVAQIDWWMSHRLLGTAYHNAPYLIQLRDEVELNDRAAGIPAGAISAVGYLYRVLTLCGLGIAFTGVSNHGSMGEHQIAHYVDCFAGERHSGALHGQLVGAASLAMARLQQTMLASPTPPRIRATRIDEADMARRMGGDVAAQCLPELRRKAFDDDAAATINDRLIQIWPALRDETAAFMVPAAEMEQRLKAAGGATTARDLGLPESLWREAIVHSREMRNRFAFVDLAADAGFLEDFAAGQT